MPDNNIRSFNDYKKKVNLDKQETEEINIEIQDPLDFLSNSEREEYYRTQREKEKKQDEEVKQSLQQQDTDFFDDFEVTYDPKDEYEEIRENKQKEPRREEAVRKEKRPRIQDEEWFDEDEGEDSGINPYLIVRIASVITGLVILILIGAIFKTKVLDRFIVPDPDKASHVEVGEVEGYTSKKDTVTTTTQLNLRSTPSTASDSFIVTNVPEGTKLKRVGVSDDGNWAQVEYEGQILYASMKYLTVAD